MMPGDKAPAAKPFELDNAFELKNAPFMLMTLTVHKPDAKRLTQMLKGRFGSAFFDETPLLIDIRPLAGRVIDLVWVVDTLKQMRACPIGVLGARDDQLAMAVKAGLAVSPAPANWWRIGTTSWSMTWPTTGYGCCACCTRPGNGHHRGQQVARWAEAHSPPALPAATAPCSAK